MAERGNFVAGPIDSLSFRPLNQVPRSVEVCKVLPMATFAFIVSVIVLAVACLSTAEILLMKCCSRTNESYDVGNNQCVEDEQILQKKWPPSVYSPEGKKKVPWRINNFNITNNLVNCEGEMVVQSSSHVTLFADGTLKVRNISPKFHPGTFCIERAVKSEGNFAARFCVPDVCKSKKCVRKCCPFGYSLDQESCEPSAIEFQLEFKNETGDALDLPANSPKIRSAVLPNCPDGRNLLDPSTYPEDEFFILPSGQLFVPSYNSDPVVDEYCIEDFLVSNIESGDEEYQRKALVCFVSSAPSAGELLVLNITTYLQFITSAFLIATVLVYVMIPEMRNIHGVNVMCHCLSLATTFITLGIIKLNNDFDAISCIIVAIVTHFAFLSSFTWLTVLSFDIWRSLTDLRPRSSAHNFRRRIRHRFPYYSAFAWGIPFVIVSIGQLLTYIPGVPEDIVKPNFGTQTCWFPANDNVILVYLYGPIAILLATNVIFFTLTAIRLCTRTERALSNKHNRKKKNSIITFSIFLLMGMTWVTEIITWATDVSSYYAAAPDILNIMTGVFIFIIFVCKKNVIEKLMNKMQLVTSFIQKSTSTWTLSASTKETRLPNSELSKDSTVYSTTTNRNVD